MLEIHETDFETIENPFHAEDGRWEDDEWVNQQAELSASEEGVK